MYSQICYIIMQDQDRKRISRLTAILTQLQSRKIQTATKLADKFDVSARTIYRDIKALEDAGVPIITEEGKGFSIMEGYRIPPVMFTENEANALITAELLIKACKDVSLINEFSTAIQKIKSVLPNHLKSRIESLESKVAITKFYTEKGDKSKYLLNIQKALLENLVLKINYSNASNVASERELEPFALFSNTNDDWVLVAYCRLKKDLRSFSLSKIESLSFTYENFIPQKITFEQYLKKKYSIN
jgi:predicted DNA-binding transcriptional regulator YafY